MRSKDLFAKEKDPTVRWRDLNRKINKRRRAAARGRG